MANMSFDAIRENKILAKISKFTVFHGHRRFRQLPFNEPRYVISNNVVFCQLLSLETLNAVRSVAYQW